MRSRPRGPDRFARAIALALAASILSSVGLTVVYALGGQPQLEGSLIFGALGGLAVALVLWGKHLMPQGPFVEEREQMAASPTERQTLDSDVELAVGQIGRRSFLGRVLVAALGALGIAAVFPIRSLGPGPGRSLFSTSWRRGIRLVTPEGDPVSVQQLPVGGIATVFPQGHQDEADAQTVLIRVDPSRLHPIPGREDWSPQGYVAYSKICTHAGCPVGLFEQSTGRLFCPCHQSVFEALDGARPSAGPAARPLPQLPLEIDAQGFIQAGGDFSEPVGPGWWTLPQDGP